MKPCWMVMLVSCMFLGFVACGGQAQLQGRNTSESEIVTEVHPAHFQTECDGPMRAEILALANQVRAAKNLPGLRCDVRLSRAARLHAEDMCAKNYLSHTSKDGRAFHERLKAQGAEFMAAGENVAHGQRSAQEVHSGWMNSAEHRKNILRKEFVRLGVGYADCGGRPYWVQGFAG